AYGFGGRGYYADLPEGLQGNGAGFSFCRLAYKSTWREPGGQGWTTDYPNADRNLMFRTEELTTVQMSKYTNGDFAHSIVTAMHKDLFKCPFLFASDVGTMALEEQEVVRLRDYLEKGGFLWVDDFWGDHAWAQWQSQIERILPGKKFVDQPLAAEWRADVRAGLRERDPPLPRDLRRARAHDGVHELEHRYRGRLGAGRGGPGVLLSVLTRRVRGRDERHRLDDDALTP